MRAFAVNFMRAGAMRLNHGYVAFIFTMSLILGGAFPAQAADVNLLGAYAFETVINVSESEREAWNRDLRRDVGFGEPYGTYDPSALVFLNEKQGKIRTNSAQVEASTGKSFVASEYLPFEYTVSDDVLKIVVPGTDFVLNCEFQLDEDYLTLYQASILGSEPVDMRFRVNHTVLSVFFPSGGDALSEEAKEVLEAAVLELTSVYADGYAKFELMGHADSIGTDLANLALSDRRNRSVIDYLAGRGVPRGMMETIAYGAEAPQSSNENEGGQALNRRVELRLRLAPHPDIFAAGTSARAHAPATLKTYVNSVGMEFALIPAGEFLMGSPEADEEADDDEKPQHRVTVSKAFYLGKYEVTQAQWEAVMGNNPSYFKGRNNPVEWVSWHDVQAFITKLNQKEGMNKYRLPTEAEWEYAARAGTTSTYSFGDDAGALGRYAWYGEDENSGSTHPVGQKEPNAWGLYDMHGNVWEWVQDRYGEHYYSNSPAIDPKGPPSGMRVFRGGFWGNLAKLCRSAGRGFVSSDFQDSAVGFRLAFSIEEPAAASSAGNASAPAASPRQAAPSPAPAKQLTGAERNLLGKHMFSLQWISWDTFGAANITSSDAGLYIEARQELDGDYVSLKGEVTAAEAKEFTVTGELVTRVSYINDGEECVRNGKFTFKAVGARKYWRMQEMENPCEDVVDYVDVYF